MTKQITKKQYRELIDTMIKFEIDIYDRKKSIKAEYLVKESTSKLYDLYLAERRLKHKEVSE